MDVTLKLDELNLKNRLSTYSATLEVTYRKVITTLDETEHPYPGTIRPIVSFSLIPGTDEEDAELYGVLKKLVLNAAFTLEGADVIKEMRLVSNLESTFLLTSVDGKRRYKGGTIQLRGVRGV